MPLKHGSSKKVIGQNIAEFHHGQTYAKTKRKYGADTANKQAVAAAFSNAKRSSSKAHKKAGGY